MLHWTRSVVVVGHIVVILVRIVAIQVYIYIFPHIYIYVYIYRNTDTHLRTRGTEVSVCVWASHPTRGFPHLDPDPPATLHHHSRRLANGCPFFANAFAFAHPHCQFILLFFFFVFFFWFFFLRGSYSFLMENYWKEKPNCTLNFLQGSAGGCHVLLFLLPNDFFLMHKKWSASKLSTSCESQSRQMEQAKEKPTSPSNLSGKG